MPRQNLMLSLLFLIGLSATTGCSNMSKVRIAGTPITDTGNIAVAPNANCSEVWEILTQGLNGRPLAKEGALALELSCATRPSAMSYVDATSEDIRRIRKQGWRFMTEARALVYDSNGNVVTTVWAGIGHKQNLTELERSAVEMKLGEALVGRLLNNDSGGQS